MGNLAAILKPVRDAETELAQLAIQREKLLAKLRKLKTANWFAAELATRLSNALRLSEDKHYIISQKYNWECSLQHASQQTPTTAVNLAALFDLGEGDVSSEVLKALDQLSKKFTLRKVSVVAEMSGAKAGYKGCESTLDTLERLLYPEDVSHDDTTLNIEEETTLSFYDLEDVSPSDKCCWGDDWDDWEINEDVDIEVYALVLIPQKG